MGLRLLLFILPTVYPHTRVVLPVCGLCGLSYSLLAACLDYGLVAFNFCFAIQRTVGNSAFDMTVVCFPTAEVRENHFVSHFVSFKDTLC